MIMHTLAEKLGFEDAKAAIEEYRTAVNEQRSELEEATDRDVRLALEGHDGGDG